MPERMSLIVFSGTVDTLMAASILTGSWIVRRAGSIAATTIMIASTASMLDDLDS